MFLICGYPGFQIYYFRFIIIILIIISAWFRLIVVHCLLYILKDVHFPTPLLHIL